MSDTQKNDIRDPMTGLFNYRYLMNELYARTKAPTGEVFAVLWVDLDNLKRINQAYGQEGGNSLIVGIGGLLASKIKSDEGGLVARYAGDEFVLVIPGVGSTENAKARAEEVRKSVADKKFLVGKGNINETVSIGVGLWNGREKPEELLKRVDEAMYAAKKQGKNFVSEAI